MGLFGSDDVERNAKYVIIDTQDSPGDGNGTSVTIPTQSKEKSISQSGWSVGGFVERNTSSGKVVDEPLEAYCSLFLVREDEIVIGLRDDDGFSVWGTDGTPEKMLHIGYDEIHGFNGPKNETWLFGRMGDSSLQTEHDEFIFSSLVSDYSDVSYDELEEYIVKKMREARKNEKSQSHGSESLSAEIRELNELHEDGVLSDEEFEAAKNRIIGEDSSKTDTDSDS